jgi:hypothetical protein
MRAPDGDDAGERCDCNQQESDLFHPGFLV